MRLSSASQQQVSEVITKQVGFVRQWKPVEDSTIDYLIKNIGRKFPLLTVNELNEIISNGISGQYGDFIKADPQTFFKWVYKFQDEQTNTKNYLHSPLLPSGEPANENTDWCKETNKCYEAFKKGVDSENFHHCVYDRLICDSEIELDTYLKFYKRSADGTEQEKNEIKIAKRKAINEYFLKQVSHNRPFIYFVRENKS